MARAVERIVVQTTALEKKAITAKARKPGLPISELMRRGATCGLRSVRTPLRGERNPCRRIAHPCEQIARACRPFARLCRAVTRVGTYRASGITFGFRACRWR